MEGRLQVACSPPLAVCLPNFIPEGPSLLPFLLADFLAHEAQFVVTIGSVTGVLDTSVLDPEPGPQGPFITYSYCVTYDFVEDEEGGGSEYVEGAPAEVCAPLGWPWGGGSALGPTASPSKAERLLQAQGSPEHDLLESDQAPGWRSAPFWQLEPLPTAPTLLAL